MRQRTIHLAASRYLLPEDIAPEELGTFLQVITRCTPIDHSGKAVTQGDWQSEIHIADYKPAEEKEEESV